MTIPGRPHEQRRGFTGPKVVRVEERAWPVRAALGARAGTMVTLGSDAHKRSRTIVGEHANGPPSLRASRLSRATATDGHPPSLDSQDRSQRRNPSRDDRVLTPSATTDNRHRCRPLRIHWRSLRSTQSDADDAEMMRLGPKNAFSLAPCQARARGYSNGMRKASRGEASVRVNSGQGSDEGEHPDQSWLVRAVPGLIVGGGLVILAAALFIADKSGVSERSSRDLTVGPFSVVFLYTTPSLMMVVAGLLTAVALVLLVHGVDALAARRVTDPARLPKQGSRRPLRAERTSNRPVGRLSVVALIPACNEEVHLPTTLAALYGQTMPPDAVWVIADNCTDRTADIARAAGANVYTTVDNRYRKAGGLNQMLARLLPTMGPLNAVLVMDADTIMVSDFIERAAAELQALPDLDAVGGVFQGDSSPGLLAQLQRNEYCGTAETSLGARVRYSF